MTVNILTIEATMRDDEAGFLQTAVADDLETLVIHNLLRTHGRLHPLLEADLRRRDLTAAQLNALLVLRAAGDDGLRMSEIGERLVVTRANVTGLVDRLEKQGLVARTAHRDRRATLVRLTVEGRKAIERAAPAHARMLAALTDCLSEREKRTLIRLLTKLRRRLRELGGDGR
ncbi:MAG: MarR family transcriptional regulator [Planctomycetes bacterium]|nr:MarR family transcriptional regulator [Planctomycetota bacterium]